MPRIYAYKKRYMLSDFSAWVKIRLGEMGTSQKTAGEWIGISQPEFSRKLKNNLFKLSDAITLFKKLEASNEEILRMVKM